MPPFVSSTWKDTSAWGQCMLVAYGQIRDLEESEEIAAMAGVKLR